MNSSIETSCRENDTNTVGLILQSMPVQFKSKLFSPITFASNFFVKNGFNLILKIIGAQNQKGF